MLIEKARISIPSVMFMVGWMRVTLLGPAYVGQLPGRSWSPRETAFFLHLLRSRASPTCCWRASP